MGLGIIDGILGFEVGGNVGVLGAIYSLVVIVPSIALIPLIGAIILIIYYVQEGTPGENEYGLNPKEVGADDISSHLVE